MNQIQTLKSTMSANYHALGQLLRDVEERHLWMLRKKKNGDTKYKNFEAWARTEVKLGRTQVQKCISVAENFTEEEVRRIGHSKLAVALQVPAERRAEVLAAAEEGASKRELEVVAAEITGKKQDQITVAMLPTDQRIPLYAKPEYPDSPPEFATCIGDCPWAIETLPNGVMQAYRVIEDDEGNLVLLISRKRRD